MAKGPVNLGGGTFLSNRGLILELIPRGDGFRGVGYSSRGAATLGQKKCTCNRTYGFGSTYKCTYKFGRTYECPYKCKYRLESTYNHTNKFGSTDQHT